MPRTSTTLDYALLSNVPNAKVSVASDGRIKCPCPQFQRKSWCSHTELILANTEPSNEGDDGNSPWFHALKPGPIQLPAVREFEMRQATAHLMVEQVRVENPYGDIPDPVTGASATTFDRYVVRFEGDARHPLTAPDDHPEDNGYILDEHDSFIWAGHAEPLPHEIMMTLQWKLFNIMNDGMQGFKPKLHCRSPHHSTFRSWKPSDFTRAANLKQSQDRGWLIDFLSIASQEGLCYECRLETEAPF